MLNYAIWLLGGVALVGVALSTFYMAEKPIRGGARWASVAHGLGGAAGTAMAVYAIVLAPDRQGFGRMAAILLGATVLVATLIIAAQLRRRRPAGLVVALHAIAGVTALVILAAYASVGV